MGDLPTQILGPLGTLILALISLRVVWQENRALRKQLSELELRQRNDYRRLAGLPEEDDDGDS